MKAIIVHGWDGTPKSHWFPWLKSQLEAKGWQVQVPAMPDTAHPKIKPWLGKLTKVAKQLNHDTYLIGHSVGCQAILRFLETLPKNIKIGGVILVAPWMELDKQTIAEEGEEVATDAQPWMETPIDFAKVQARANKFICLFSDNDPYVPTRQKNLFKRELNAKVIIQSRKGHFIERKYPMILEIINKYFA